MLLDDVGVLPVLVTVEVFIALMLLFFSNDRKLRKVSSYECAQN